MTDDPRRERINRLRKIELAVLLPLLLLAFLAFRALGTVEVVGHSMHPTLRDGQRVLVLKWFRLAGPLQVGDIVTIRGKSPNIIGQEVIKRIAFIQNARGDRPWPETISNPVGEYRSVDLFPDNVSACPLNVPGGIYLLGDNLEGSEDSRDFGAVQERDIFGKVIRQ